MTGLARHPTTIELPHYDVGRWAVLELLRMIGSGRDRPAPHVALPCPLVRRGSTASVPRGNKVPEPGHLDFDEDEMILALSLLSDDKAKITTELI